MRIFLIMVGFLFFAVPAYAEPAPGDSCTTYTTGNFMQSGGPELSGTVHFMTCEAGIWKETTFNPDPCDSSPAVGLVCSDGAVYAGLSPDGNVKMFTTPADAPGTYSWNNGTTSYIDTALQNCLGADAVLSGYAYCSTGKADTALLAGLSNADAPYQAAKYCNDLVAHGRSDWYLPSVNEAAVLASGKVAIGGFNLSGEWYWTSSESTNSTARMRKFDDGSQYADYKVTVHRVRCVRR